MDKRFKIGLLAATAAVAVLASTASSAQEAPSGGFYRADGSRTPNYQEAVASWREDKQFAVDYSKAFLGLEHAYARGLTGRGLTVGVNDSGVYVAHPLFQAVGKVNGLRTAVPSGYGNDGLGNPRRPWESHGTHVAGTIAGDRVAGQTMFGNAFDAKILSASVNFSTGDFLWFKDRVIDGKTVETATQNLVDLATTGQVRIINNSWGSSTSLPLDASLPTVLAAYKRNYADLYKPVLDGDVLVVFSAGNGRGVHASLDASAPLSDSRLRPNWLSIANYASASTATPSTSFCGQTATWCVAGPGREIISSVASYTMDNRGLQALYPRTSYPSLYAAPTPAALQTAATGQFLRVLNNYLTARRAGGSSFDEDAARRDVARQAVAITLVAASRLNSPDGATARLGEMLTFSGYMSVLTPAFSSAVLEYANTELQRVLAQYVTYKGAGYEPLTGTSMAAPNISGFAALLMENFPEYSTALISDILVSSSMDLDAPGVDLRSGWGAPQMDVALNGPTALRGTRDVTVSAGSVDVWSNNIGDARDRYSADVRVNFGDDIGGLIKKGGGELILSGANDYSGPTDVTGGLLTLNGSLMRSRVTVAELGMVGGTGRVSELTAASGGVVSPGDTVNPFGTLTVAGDVNFKPGSFLWIRSSVNGGAYSRLSVGGATRIEGGEVILKADKGEWNLRSQMNIIQSTGQVTGAFSGAQTDLALLKPVLTYASNGVLLTVRRNDVTLASLAATPNRRSVAAALDVMIDATPEDGSGGRLALENAILDASVGSVRSALRSLTGEIHAAIGGAAVSDTRILRDAMSERRTRSAESSGRRGVAVWGSAFAGDARQSVDDGLAGYRNEGSGYLVGFDKRLTETAYAGVAVGGSRADIHAARLRSSGRLTGDQLGIYGGWKVGAFDVNVGGSWTNAAIRTDRTALLNQFGETLTERYRANVWQTYGELSWNKVLGPAVLVPYAALARVEFDAFVAENGGDAALSGKVRQRSNLLTAGLRTRVTLAGDASQPRLSAVSHLAYTRDLNDEGPAFNAAFADGPMFRIEGASPASDTVATALALNIRADDRKSVELGYAGVHGETYHDNRLYGKVSLKF